MNSNIEKNFQKLNAYMFNEMISWILPLTHNCNKDKKNIQKYRQNIFPTNKIK